ncbi:MULTISPECIES: tetratricopeptide repeat protein [Massilia]|jgi:uncharacterized protein|uniref:tetratricopeptide repeat protein n=1 Tax=Massilia TaxID=149698 RepID=UPI0004825424|nr:tetratricopeptide repeat protein [Massilia alkalitolerans]
MSDGYYLAYDAYRRHLRNDTRPPIKVVRELEASDHAHALLVAAFIRHKYEGKFSDPKVFLGDLIKAGEEIGYAEYLAGRCYAEGYGTGKYRKTAARRYQKAADMGSLRAMLALGRMYLQGDGITCDPDVGLKLLERAASERIPYLDRHASGRDGTILDTVFDYEERAQTEAMEELGMLYLHGTADISQDMESARYWLKRAAENGSSTAKSALKKLPPPPPPVPKPAPKEPLPVPGKSIIDVGAKVGDMDSTAAYEHGMALCTVVDPDYKRAARYFHIALQLGHKDAKSAYEKVKNTVGEREFSLFFAGWGVGHQP